MEEFAYSLVAGGDPMIQSPPCCRIWLKQWSTFDISNAPNYSQIGRQTDEKMCVLRKFKGNSCRPQLKEGICLEHNIAAENLGTGFDLIPI